MAITDDRYRSIMSKFAAGVTVVTATDESGVHFGLTVSAFCAVSLTPPLVLVCVANESNTLPVIRESMAYTVNILGQESHGVAIRFASREDDKFSGLEIGFADLLCGPILTTDAVAYLACSVEDHIVAGDHHILIGLVEDAGLTDSDAPPLIYSDREFGRMIAIPS